ncbi:MAG: CHAT domain-containing protein [Tildeniella nuda ZEHNDER 1965/U140]|nr:CHAT domain-containing protein [Tildeniella nuda ZEHNDER 1965/U140]
MKGVIVLVLALLATLFLLAPGVAQLIEVDRDLNGVVAQQPELNAQSLLQQGREAYKAGQFDQSVQFWQQAATVAASQGDRLLQAMALSNLSLAYQQLGDWTQATTTIATSLQLLGQPTATAIASTSANPPPHRLTSEERQVLAQVLNTQGKLQFALGKAEPALESWKQAAENYTAIGDSTGAILSVLNQAQALKSLGFYKRADALLEPLYSTRREQPLPLQVSILLNYGDTLRQLGRLSEQSPSAQTVLQQGLKLAQQIKSSSDMAAALIGLGRTTLAQRNIQATLYADRPSELQTSYQEAFQYYQQTAGFTDPDARKIQALLNQQQALLKGNNRNSPQWLQAQALSPQIQFQLDRLPISHTALYAYIHLAENLIKLGSEQTNSDVVQLLETAAKQAESLGDFQIQSYVLWRKFDQQTLQFYQQAAKIGDSPASNVQALLNQQSLLVDGTGIDSQQQAQALSAPIQAQLDRLPVSHTNLYARIHFARNLLKLGAEPSRALAMQLLTTTAKQAESLGDVQAQSYAVGYLGSEYEQNQQWQVAQTFTQQALSLARTVNAADIAYRWQWQLGRLLKAQNDTQGAIAAYTQAVETLNALRKDLATINTDNVDVQFSFRLSAEPVYLELVDLLLQHDEPTQHDRNLEAARSVIESLQTAELENFLREACGGIQAPIEGVDPAAAIVYPIMLNDRLEVIVSLYDPQTLRRVRLLHYSTAITPKAVDRLTNQFRQSLIPSAPISDHRRLGKTIYDWLIRPAEAELAQSGVKTLVFIMNGNLRNLPMAALYDGSQYLVQKYGVALTPGLQLIDPRPLEHKQINALIAGLTESTQGFPALPSVGTEVKDIHSQIPSKLILNEQLTNKNLEQQLGNAPYSVIHLATHGQFSSNADQTFILTWDQRLSVKQLDQLLQTRDKNEANALELLVLSACQTASGDSRAALGLAGIAVQSGARSTIASLWPVNDEATAAFMTQFYQVLNQQNVSKAQALRQAQLFLVSKYPSPYYWAPFVLVGNWL